MQQSIGMPVEIGPTPAWTFFSLYSYEEEYTPILISSGKVKARHFHLAKRFTNDPFSVNDGGEFWKSISEIYPCIQQYSSLSLNIRVTNASFLKLDITIIKWTLAYKFIEWRGCSLLPSLSQPTLPHFSHTPISIE